MFYNDIYTEIPLLDLPLPWTGHHCGKGSQLFPNKDYIHSDQKMERTWVLG